MRVWSARADDILGTANLWMHQQENGILLVDVYEECHVVSHVPGIPYTIVQLHHHTDHSKLTHGRLIAWLLVR